MTPAITIDPLRRHHLNDQFPKDYFQNIIQTIKSDKSKWITIYPKGQDIFRSFDLTPRDKVEVVILGQDPYHGHGQAHGLCFSVPEWVIPPPSLINIYKELEQEYPDHKANYNSGDLTKRAEQWVFLLNAFLTVQAGNPLSHSKIGRETFTNHVIKTLSDQKTNLVFMLWGNFAKSKAVFIDNQKHLVLISNHPSPLSANKGWWFGCNHFRLCNKYLESHQKKAINWID